LVPNDYKDNCEFWELRCTENYQNSTLLHLSFESGLSNALPRLKLLNQFIPSESWQKMLLCTDAFGFTPLMHSLFSLSEIDDQILSLLIPTEVEMQFWRSTVNERANRTKGFNVLHICIMNEEFDAEDGLKCLQGLQFLRVQMGEEMWQELLQMKNNMVLKETPVEMAYRLGKSKQVINELK